MPHRRRLTPADPPNRASWSAMQTIDPPRTPRIAPSPIPAGPHPYVPRLPVPDADAAAVCDEAVAELRAAADRWTRASAAEVAARCSTRCCGRRCRDRRTAGPTSAPGTRAWTPPARTRAEETIVGPYIFLRGVRLHRDALAGHRAHGRPAHPRAACARCPTGAWSARVFPGDLVDRVTYLGHDRRGVDGARGHGRRRSRTRWRTPTGRRCDGRVCLVLGAGNASSIGPLDAIHKLFVEQQVVVLKLHPVMAHLAEVQEAALAPLVRAGVLRIVHGDAVQGAHLAQPPGRGHAPHHGRGPHVRRDRLRDRGPTARSASAATSRSCPSRSPRSSAT